MKKIFWQDPYQTKINATVTYVKEGEVLFDQTIAYSFSGGQESDKAFVNEIPILSSRMEGNLIYYTLPLDHNLKIGDSVLMTIDWTRRYKLMRLHFTAELILEIVTQNYGFEKIGAHISEDKARIDFLADTNVSQYFDEILKIYNDIIVRDLPIEKGFTDESTQRRYWKIEGFAQVPCGGTHVKSTAEVGFVALKRDKPGKGKERIEIRLLNT